MVNLSRMEHTKHFASSVASSGRSITNQALCPTRAIFSDLNHLSAFSLVKVGTSLQTSLALKSSGRSRRRDVEDDDWLEAMVIWKLSSRWTKCSRLYHDPCGFSRRMPFEILVQSESSGKRSNTPAQSEVRPRTIRHVRSPITRDYARLC